MLEQKLVDIRKQVPEELESNIIRLWVNNGEVTFSRSVLKQFPGTWLCNVATHSETAYVEMCTLEILQALKYMLILGMNDMIIQQTDSHRLVIKMFKLSEWFTQCTNPECTCKLDHVFNNNNQSQSCPQLKKH